MNAADRKEFDLIHNKIDNITQSIDELKSDMDKAHIKTEENLKFIKESLFNPHDGLWAETKCFRSWFYGINDRKSLGLF